MRRSRPVAVLSLSLTGPKQSPGLSWMVSTELEVSTMATCSYSIVSSGLRVSILVMIRR